jgi:hypothetical protein
MMLELTSASTNVMPPKKAQLMKAKAAERRMIADLCFFQQQYYSKLCVCFQRGNYAYGAHSSSSSESERMRSEG